MPRKNHNAQPIYRPKASGPGSAPGGLLPRRESWVGLLPYQGRIELRNSGLKVTGESIVREHRQMTDDRRREINGGRQSMVDGHFTTFQPYRVIPQSHPSFIRRFFDRINWQTLSDYACCILVAMAIEYVFVLKIIPFIVKEFWK